ncbi:unnamed protein product [Cuscuta epithymum]|uniref:DUF4283 domain-containing protein n=1 Tax=Cuscuta epithymum TaxID=186058 RepID=A0AAV0C9M4_9ASTE|nr:unnamed protein product [Cuscuta epithymum]
MRVTKWTPAFQPNVESPVVPVWIGFEGLPIHLFDRRALFDIAGLIGTPLKIDAATANLSRPYVTSVCVELDLTVDNPQKIRIQCGSYGFTQQVTYEDKPDYCKSCLHLGHSASKCPKRVPKHNVQPQQNIRGDHEERNKSTTLEKEKWIVKQPQILKITNGENAKENAKVSDPSTSKQMNPEPNSREIETVDIEDASDTEEVYHNPKPEPEPAVPNQNQYGEAKYNISMALAGLTNHKPVGPLVDDSILQFKHQEEDHDPEIVEKDYSSDGDTKAKGKAQAKEDDEGVERVPR